MGYSANENFELVNTEDIWSMVDLSINYLLASVVDVNLPLTSVSSTDWQHIFGKCLSYFPHRQRVYDAGIPRAML